MPQSIVTVVILQTRYPYERAKFSIHKAFLCYYSPFFDRIFNGPVETTEFKLEAVNKAMFATFIHWVCSQVVQGGNDVALKDFGTIVDLWKTAEIFEVPELQNKLMDMLYLDPFSDVVHCDWGTIEKFKIDVPKRLIFDRLAIMDDRYLFDAAIEKLPVLILLDFTKLLKDFQLGRRLEVGLVSDYYVPVPKVKE